MNRKEHDALRSQFLREGIALGFSVGSDEFGYHDDEPTASAEWKRWCAAGTRPADAWRIPGPPQAASGSQESARSDGTRSQKLADAGFTRRPSLWAMQAREILELIAAPKRADGTWNRDREACRQLAAEALGRDDGLDVKNGGEQGATPPAPAAPEGWKLVPIEATPEMVQAYLRANDAYWHRTDALPDKLGVWRQGTPTEATAESYRAMLAVAPAAEGGAS